LPLLKNKLPVACSWLLFIKFLNNLLQRVSVELVT
jgi:hypothetical protein